MLKLIALAVIATVFTGCASFDHAHLTYSESAEYRNSKGLETASDGWVLVNASEGEVVLNAPNQFKPAMLTNKKSALAVDHYLKVWYHPQREMVVVQNIYRQKEEISKVVILSIPGAIERRQMFYFNPVGQAIYILDLKNGNGVGHYSGDFDITEVMNMAHFQKRLDNFRPGLAEYGHNKRAFFENTNIKYPLYRETTSALSDLSFDESGNVSNKDDYFSFAAGMHLWKPFMEAVQLNGADEGKWRKWDGRSFFMKTLKIHLPGVYYDGRYFKEEYAKESQITQPTGPMLISRQTSPFMDSTGPLWGDQKDRLLSIRKEQPPTQGFPKSRLYNRLHELLMLRD